MYKKRREELEQILSEISTEEIKLQNQEKKAELLKEVPCGSEYSHCKFIRDAYVAVDKLSLTKKNCGSLQECLTKSYQRRSQS